MVLIKKSKNYPKAIKTAYALLVEYRRKLEEDGDEEYAAFVEKVYKDLWCEALNERAPW